MAALVALAGCISSPGCTQRREAPPSPIVLPDVSGHTALLIDHVGAYELESDPQRDLGHPSAQLALSPAISCFATWHTEAVHAVEVAGGEGLVRLHATLVIETLRQPILAGYSLGWTRLGPSVVGLATEGQPTQLPPFTCPQRAQAPRR